MGAAAIVVALLGYALSYEVQAAWKDAPSGRQCTRNDITTPPLVIISLDGFAVDYLKRGATPNLETFGRNGVRAQHIYATYPTRTFVNHYTMVTGLWAESHGIVDNNIYDPTITDSIQDMTRTKFHGFYRGEPIWSSVKRQLPSSKVACLYWAGCGMNITQYQPDYNPSYNGSAPTESRVDQILSWLSLPPADRPSLILAYMKQPDEAGHFRKDDDEITSALKENDAAIDRLMAGIEGMGLIDCVNVVIVSDHGMTDVKTHVYFDEKISLDGIVPVYGVVGRIYRKDPNRTTASVTGPYECTNGSVWRVYDRATMPARYHYTGTPRVGDFIFEGQPGTTFYATRADDWFMSGDHGYDYITPSMRTIFFARGPSVRNGILLPPFQNVEYFNIFEDLLGIPHTIPNNGTVGVVDQMYSRIIPRDMEIFTIPSCSPSPMQASVTPCAAECRQEDVTNLATSLAQCTASLQTFSGLGSLTRETPFCATRTCGIEVLSSPRNPGPTVVTELLTYEGFMTAPKMCTFEIDEQGCGVNQFFGNAGNATLTMKNLLLNNQNPFSGFLRTRVQLYEGFLKTFLNPLDTLIANWVQRFGRMQVISGTIHDHDHNGLADPNIDRTLPSHVFRVLITCRQWRRDMLGCADVSSTRVISFVMPHVERDANCIPATKLLLAYTARIADVETMTGLRFFADPNVVPAEAAAKLRSFVTTELWQPPCNQ